ncbi:hypothetical protein BLL42_23535 [Pseudomonas frederiksbergensis]|uniref:Uncharacterized protein n=1 Tax=Pseudomonas frederiksbergensis TaxID=104087 RepID=A0A1J0EQW0_9PSED|nr:hypothetical protein [Pseudomonas frederiksbergensis]APC18538.1 hypothetical protein BLL42_23535 [Pseudomonas frederiksbergensis]
MTERYYFSSEHLTAEEKNAALAFASDRLEKGNTVHIFIVAKKLADDFLRGAFDSVALNKLKNGDQIKVGNVVYSLEADRTFKNYTSYEVVVAFHVSDRLLEKLESGQIQHLVVCNFEQDRPDKWMELAPKLLKSSAPAENQ